MRTIGPRYIIWDMKDLTFLDSSGNGLILGRYNEIEKIRGVMGLIGLNNYSRKIITISGLFQIIKEYRKKSNVIGKKVKISPVINQEQNDFEALVLDITDEAKLKVQTEKNEILFLESGEISTKII
jgi:hypothetical protein